MPDERTIDRVAVGLAEMTLEWRDKWSHHCASTGTGIVQMLPAVYGYLLDLIGLYVPPDDPIPAWAERALQDHHGEPADLVATLRELARKEKAKPLEPAQRGICAKCGGEIRRCRLGWGPWGNWRHVGPKKDHPATPKGENE